MSSSENLNRYAQSRQTGEEFRSRAPPSCRIEFCGLTENNIDDTEE